MQNKIRFKIGDIAAETRACEPALVKAIQGFSSILKNLEYSGSLGEKNSRQLDIHLDEAVFDVLKTKGSTDFSVGTYSVFHNRTI